MVELCFSCLRAGHLVGEWNGVLQGERAAQVSPFMGAEWVKWIQGLCLRPGCESGAPRLGALHVQGLEPWSLCHVFGECRHVCFSFLHLGGRDNTPWPSGRTVCLEYLLWSPSPSSCSFSRYLVSACFVPATVLGMRNTSVDETNAHPLRCSYSGERQRMETERR